MSFDLVLNSKFKKKRVKMKVIDAYWDEKNLGLKSFEVSLDKNDSVEAFVEQEKEILSKEGSKYIVVKVPPNNYEYLTSLPKLGYTFIEASLKLILRKRDYNCPRFVMRFDKDCKVESLEEEKDFQRVFREIEKGIFKTDRIAIDKDFSVDMANQRYINWIRSLKEKGEKIYEVYVKDKAIGFFILKHVDDANVQGILTGLYKEFEESGYGALIMKKLKDKVWELGYRTYHAQVVSNNVKALRSNLIFGSMVESINYHYIKKIRK